MEQNTKSGGGRTLVGGTGYDVKIGPQKQTFTLTLPDVFYCDGIVEFSDGQSIGFATGTYTREFEPGATVTIQMYWGQQTIVILLYDNGKIVAWNKNEPYSFVAETDCTLTASCTYDSTYNI